MLLACTVMTHFGTCEATPRSSYAVFHRLAPSATAHHGTQTTAETNRSISEWQKRAVLEIALDAQQQQQLLLSRTTANHFKVSSFSKLSDPLILPPHSRLSSPSSWEYQLSLVPQDSRELPGESGRPDTGFALTSFPLCALEASSDSGVLEEYLNIWVRRSGTGLGEQEGQSIHNLQLDLLGIQWSSSLSTSTAVWCEEDVRNAPEGGSVWRAKLDMLARHHGSSHIKVSVREPERLPEPVLTAYQIQKAPEVLPDGTVKPAPPEKSWLAKYWIYILPVVIMLVLGGGPPPPEDAPPPPAARPQ